MGKKVAVASAFGASVLVSDALHAADFGTVTVRFHGVGDDFGGSASACFVDVAWMRSEIVIVPSGERGDSYNARRDLVVETWALDRLAEFASAAPCLDVGSVPWGVPYAAKVSSSLGSGSADLLRDVGAWLADCGDSCAAVVRKLHTSGVAHSIRYGRQWWDAKAEWEVRLVAGADYFRPLARALRGADALECRARALLRDAQRVREWTEKREAAAAAAALTLEVLP